MSQTATPFNTADIGSVAVLVPCYNEAVTIAKVIDVFGSRRAFDGA